MKHPIAVAALAILSALSAQSAEIKIPNPLPEPDRGPGYVITAPGTYVLTGNIVWPDQYDVIDINASMQGPIILDLNGFTINGVGGISNTGITVGGSPQTYAVTIRNGTMGGFLSAISVFGEPTINKVTIHNIVFTVETNGNTGSASGIFFSSVANSTISNCSFSNGGTNGYGINDRASAGGNVYSNNYFAATISALEVTNYTYPPYSSSYGVPALPISGDPLLDAFCCWNFKCVAASESI
jgi:hypothetical protein